jgi:hypothetical protein
MRVVVLGGMLCAAIGCSKTVDLSADDIQAKLAGRGGAGTSIDVDTVDGQHASSFAPASHTHIGAEVTSQVASATAADTVPWTGITGVPATFAPTSHQHSGTDVTSKISSASVADSVPWSGITGVPSTFVPSIHQHTGSDVTSKVSAATNADTVPWTGITGKPDLAPAEHTHAGTGPCGPSIAWKDANGTAVPNIYDIGTYEYMWTIAGRMAGTTQRVYRDADGNLWGVLVGAATVGPFNFSATQYFTTPDCTGTGYHDASEKIPGAVYYGAPGGALPAIGPFVMPDAGYVMSMSYQSVSYNGSCQPNAGALAAGVPATTLSTLPTVSFPPFPYAAPLHPVFP